MGVPDFQSIMLPLLKFSLDKKEHSSRESIKYLTQEFNLTDEDRDELLPSGTQKVFDNRVGWSRTYLKKAGLLESKKRGYFNITNEGLKVLEQNPPRIDIDFLMQFPGYVEFRTGVKNDTPNELESSTKNLTPEETLEYSYQRLRDNIAQELINNVKSCTPEFFEKLVVDLLNMGYGGSRRDAGEAIGKSGDGGLMVSLKRTN
jgi:restriction system protein